MQTLWRDLRYGIRMLKKSPGFTCVAVATLAVAIGANAVVFSVLNGLILRPLNIPDARGLYTLNRASDQSGKESYANYVDLRDRNHTFAALVAYNINQVGVEIGKNASRAWVMEVSGNYFDGLGIQPAIGRFLHESDERGDQSAPYLVLTDTYWRRNFQGDRGVVGRVVQVNKHPYTIVGVAPPGFHGTALLFSTDFFVPIVNTNFGGLHRRGSRWMDSVIGHLKPGVTRAEAIADLNAIGADLEKKYPKDDFQMSFLLMHEGLGGDSTGTAIQAFIGGLMLLAALILLAACANLGSLFAARAADRSREVALRLALGAGRLRILRQLFTEASLISLTGGAVGLWFSVWLLHWLSVWNPFPQYPLNMPVNPDVRVYGVALLLSLISGLLFGAVPVRQVLRADAYQIIKSGATSAPGRRFTARDLLLGVQVAICAVLITSSLVAVRGLERSLHSNFGFDPRGVTLVQTDTRMAGYNDESGAQLQRRMIDAVAAIPSVDSVALVNNPPLQVACCVNSYVFPDQTAELSSSHAVAAAASFSISPDYFGTAGTTLLAGRSVSWHDDQHAPRVAVINQVFARRLFAAEANAIGKYFKTIDGSRIQVVGIVQDGKYTADINETPQAAMFLPILQAPSSETWLVVGSNNSNAQALSSAIRGKLRELDSGLTTFVESWSQVMGPALFPSRMAAASLGVLGGMGGMLSITGIFGLAAYSVSKRRRDLGIRMALGAQRREVLKAALGRAGKLLAFGSAAGLVLGILASRVLASIVYEATSRDPLVLAGAVLAMALLGLLATWIPAQRVLSINPAMLMRED
jgi:predicted permease